MTARDSSSADMAFERTLLESARRDGPSEATQQEAWARFVAATGGVALASGATLAPGGLRRALRQSRLRWFALGALGGCVATAAWLKLQHPPAPATSPVAASSALPTALSVVPVVTAPTSSATAPEPTPPAVPLARAVGRAPQATPRAVPAGSTLALEIEALDVVQTALTAGAYERALGLVQRYQRDFPAGQLGTDAEVLAIEALAGAGRTQEAASRGRDFLARHPHDPHVSRVTAVTARLAAP